MIDQFAIYLGTKELSDKEKNKILKYPNIQIDKEIENKFYMVKFHHDKKLNQDEFNLEGRWIVAENKTYEADLGYEPGLHDLNEKQ